MYSSVIARLENTQGKKGLCAFILERGAIGVTFSTNVEKMGLRTAQMGQLEFEKTFIPKENLLGSEGAGLSIFANAMEWERGLILAPTLGTMKRQFEASLAYVQSRKQFGQSIGKFQRVTDKLVNMYIALETGDLLMKKFTGLKDAGHLSIAEASIVKLHISETWISLSQDVIQLHGGSGYLTANELERDLRDALGSRLYSGTSDIQRMIIGNWLGLG